jgi:hypothetical protein
MKRLLILALFLFAASAMASGECPASPGDIEGQIRCGELDCPQYVLHAWNTGNTCYARMGFLCCGRGMRFTSREGEVDATWPVTLLRYQNGHRFDGHSGRVEVVSTKTGAVLRSGHYFSNPGLFQWDDGLSATVERECSPDP